jgi:hypothetical protein
VATFERPEVAVCALCQPGWRPPPDACYTVRGMSRHRLRTLAVGLGAAAILVVAALGWRDGDERIAAAPERTTEAGLAAADPAPARPAGRAKAAGGGFKPRKAKLQKQGSRDRIKPRPQGKHSRGDRGAIWDRDCMMQPPQTRSKPCVFGMRKSRKTVVLFGDSHAMHLFGAVNRLAKRRGWRLVAQTKAGCGPNDAPVYNNKVDRVYRECRRWHRNVLRRIDRVKPRIILTGVARAHKPMRNGRIIREGQARRDTLKAGYESMLERLLATGARVVASRDLPKAPHDMTDCVDANLDRLRHCSFRKPPNHGRTWESQAARAVAGVAEIDLSPGICTKRRCFGVIRNELVYRDDDHLTATFARTLAPWLARALRRAGR